MSERQVIEQEFSEPISLGDQNLVTNSTFNEGASLGAYTNVQNCVINGTLHPRGENCTVTGCYVVGNDQPGIYIGAGHNEQRSIQIAHEDWPTNAIMDINQGRTELQNQGYINVDFVLVAPRSILRLLDMIMPNADTTYGQFLLRSGLVDSFQEIDDDHAEVTLTAPHGAFGGRAHKFTNNAIEKSWRLLEEYMSPSQHFAFMEGSKIELENKIGNFRLLIDKNGDFSVLEGKRGKGIMATSGRIKSYDYPLGDEIATFLDWFKFKTKELIAKWNCGTYGIVKEGQRR